MGGAKNCPETPRQKMIGVMYLVLTAMLALNVSSSILEGFSMVDSSLHTSIESSLFRNEKAYEDFKELNSTNPEKYGQWLAKANEVKVKSDELYNYIEAFKKEIVKMVDKDDANDSAYVKQIKDKANLDKPAEYAILKGNGKKLKDKIDG
jgi:gliding motility-associated protein GldM